MSQKNKIKLNKVSEQLESLDVWLCDFTHEVKKLMLSGTKGTINFEIKINDGGGFSSKPIIITKRDAQS